MQLTAVIATLSAAAAIYWDPPWLFPLIIAVGGLITIVYHRKEDMSVKVCVRARARVMCVCVCV